MAFQFLPGMQKVIYPAWPYGHGVDHGLTLPVLVIDAATEKVAFIGRFWSPDYTAKTINTVSFMTGSPLVSAGGSTIRVSFQNLSAVAQAQPNGTQSQFRDIALNTMTATTWTTTGLVTSDGTNGGVKRTVQHGDLFAVVFEYQAFAGADALRIAGNTSPAPSTGGFASLFTGAWAAQALSPILVFTNSDGSIATMYETVPRTGISEFSPTNVSSPNEYGVEFTAPVTMQIDALSVFTYIPSTSADQEFSLYQDTTLIASVAFPGIYTATTSPRWCLMPLTQKYTLTKGTKYILSQKATSGTAIRVLYTTVADAAHYALWPQGADTRLVQRTGAGAWAENATLTRKIPHFGVAVAAIDDGAGGGLTGILC
jgi:hypothetical protein